MGTHQSQPIESAEELLTVQWEATAQSVLLVGIRIVRPRGMNLLASQQFRWLSQIQACGALHLLLLRLRPLLQLSGRRSALQRWFLYAAPCLLSVWNAQLKKQRKSTGTRWRLR